MENIELREVLHKGECDIYTIQRLSSNGVSIWGRYFNLNELIDALKKINTDYEAHYMIKKEHIKVIDNGMYDYENEIVHKAFCEISKNLKVKCKPALSLYWCTEIIKTT